MGYGSLHQSVTTPQTADIGVASTTDAGANYPNKRLSFRMSLGIKHFSGSNVRRR